MPTERVRLDKLLRTLGLGTRSQVHALIRAGRIAVAGAAVRDPGHLLRPETEPVALDGSCLPYQRVHLLMLCKPAGVITAARDPAQRTVLDLLPPLYRACGCMPVGRLDKDTEGLLLLTNDGELAHRILHPKRQVEKLYHARVDGALGEAHRRAFAAGLTLSDFQALPARLELDADDPCAARVTVREGKYHQVKRMFAACGRHVLALKRLAIGPIHLDPKLAPGEYRSLTGEESAALRAACGLEEDDA